MLFDVLLKTDNQEERFKIYEKLIYYVLIGKMTMGDLLAGLRHLKGGYLLEFFDYVVQNKKGE